MGLFPWHDCHRGRGLHGRVLRGRGHDHRHQHQTWPSLVVDVLKISLNRDDACDDHDRCDRVHVGRGLLLHGRARARHGRGHDRRGHERRGHDRRGHALSGHRRWTIVAAVHLILHETKI